MNNDGGVGIGHGGYDAIGHAAAMGSQTQQDCTMVLRVPPARHQPLFFELAYDKGHTP